MGPLIESLLQGIPLEPTPAQELMTHLLSGEATDAQIAGVLIALKAKGTSGSELASFVRALNAQALPVEHGLTTVVDSCGTGGGIPSFNISTAAAVVAAAAGAYVGKHGNRAVTSTCGSADVLEELGAKLEQTPERQSKILRDCGLIFMFAPNHHPAMKHVGKVRRELGTRTVFNQLGPLANPAAAQAQLIGTYDRELLEPMAQAAIELGRSRVLCVHAADGLDEISPTHTTFGFFGDASGIRELEIGPFFKEADVSPGDSRSQNATILREAISDASSPRCLAVLPSAGAVLWLAGLATSINEGVLLARATIADGGATRKLDSFIEASQQ
ncbi:MAG: anthranilate phosphoribosyltransferase [Fimbriimonadaceae bacterium]